MIDIRKLLSNKETRKLEVLTTPVGRLGFDIKTSLLRQPIERHMALIKRRGIRLKPHFYLGEDWGCVAGTANIEIGFYDADLLLKELNAEVRGWANDPRTIDYLLRHETGHAFCYAHRLYKSKAFRKVFGVKGSFFETYPETGRFKPHPWSRDFVNPNRDHYAQKHPDEDFAETFAVWLTPRSSWRRRYRHWPAIRKLFYVDHLMKEIRRVNPPRGVKERFFRPVEKMNWLLAEHYGKEAERFRRAARGYVDDRLREVFPPVRGDVLRPAAALLRKNHDRLLGRVIQWSLLTEKEGQTILHKLEARSVALKLSYRPGKEGEKLLDIVSLAVGLAMDYAYTGRLTG